MSGWGKSVKQLHIEPDHCCSYWQVHFVLRVGQEMREPASDSVSSQWISNLIPGAKSVLKYPTGPLRDARLRN
jgi:hypothetical protein